MLKKKVSLPPLDYFVAFEAAAVHGSFARASDVLHISETAISRKVRLLEQHFNLPLFARGHRSITLTDHGAELLTSVEKSLRILRDASEFLAEREGRDTVNLAATNSVASLWLLPRLAKFNATNSRTKIMLTSSDNDHECLSESMDLSILRGDGEWPGFEATLLFGETVFPVCSPEYLENNRSAASIERLPEVDLIEVSSSHTEWMNWRTWLGEQSISDVPADRRAYFNTYPLAIQAAVDGLGLALGWGHLVDHLVDANRLVRPLGDRRVRTRSGYYLLRNHAKKTFQGQKLVQDWLLEQSAARKRYGAE